ncbi:lytic transglycosylase [Deinococcus aquaticus]|uniref:lytic transglycosylase n=1 Tax=Deinococcus aquaticus TaxID=328692 RepID=UPI00360B5368
MPFPFPRGLTFRAAVTGALLSAAMTAQAQQATPLEQLLLPLQPNLQVPADLTLDRAPRTLDILTNGTTPATAVARRYGVPASAVKVSATRKGLRYVRVTLADRDLTRRPQRPATVERYVVRPGDTMARVAARFGITLVDLLSLNLNRNSLDDLNAGAVLNVPTGETGLLVRIKPGQSALSLIAGYGADIVETARANDALPTELQVGDLLLLPGIRAESFVETLAKKREAERQAALAAERQRRYDAYLAQKKQRARERLEAGTPRRRSTRSTSPGRAARSGRPASPPTNGRRSTRRPRRPAAPARPRPAPRRPVRVPWQLPAAARRPAPGWRGRCVRTALPAASRSGTSRFTSRYSTAAWTSPLRTARPSTRRPPGPSPKAVTGRSA